MRGDFSFGHSPNITGGEQVEAFNDTMDAEQRTNYVEFQGVAGAISERSGNVLRYIVSKKDTYYDSENKVWVISAEKFRNGAASTEVARGILADVWQDATVHEIGHAIENTPTGKALRQHLASDKSVLGMAVSDYLGRNYSVEFFGKDKAKAKDKLLALIAKADKGESLTEQEQKVYAEYRDEVGTFMEQRVLGTKSFIKKLIQTETSTAEKVLNKVRELYESFKNRKSKDARNAAEYLHKAEQLYMDALSEVGGTYQNGKIHLANREEDEEGEIRRLAAPKDVDNETVEGYNNDDLYTATAAFGRDVAKEDQHAFARSLANKTAGLSKGQVKTVEIYGVKKIYWFEADGYMHGKMLRSVDADDSSGYEKARKEFENELDRNRETFDSWSDALSVERTRKKGDLSHSSERSGAMGSDGLLAAEQRRNRAGDQGGSEQNHQIDLKEVDELIAKLKAMVESPIEDVVVDDAIRDLQEGEDIIKKLREMIEAESQAREVKKSHNSADATPSAQENSDKVRRSRAATGEVVTLSKGQLAALQANYHGEKVFTKKDVTAALKGIEALQGLPADIRNDLVNRLWTGYNQRLHQQGFEMFTDVMWHQIHAEVLQENGFEMTEDEIAKMDEQIVAALHQIVASGKQSIKAKLESATSTEGYRKQANYWRDEHARTVERNKLLGRVKHEVERLANMKAGRYVNAANYKNQSFAQAITELARMNWRGGLVRDQKIRERFATLDTWYSKENPLYKGDGNGNELFRQDIKDALSALGNGQNGVLTNDDLLAAETVIKYFAHEIEAHNTVYKNGKRVDAMPEAKRYIENVARAKEVAVKCGIWQRLTRSGFARLVADPAMLMRQADGYLDGFFTEQYEQLRQGTIDAAVLERELAEDFEKFWDEHKAYGKRYNNATVTFDGKELPLQEAISLYMTMKREQAFAGLAGAGFEIEGKDATESVSEGFADEVEKFKTEEYNKLPPEELLTLTKEGHARIERVALEKAVEAQREALAKQFTDEDKALISLMEKTLEKCRDVKVEIDEIVQGYSNVTGGYYFPIRRTGLAENVDAWTGFEGDRVSNLSINKDTVKNAHKLLIEPAHIVFMRHLKAVSLYHGLGVFTDNFNRLYNLNVNGPQIKNAAERAVSRIDLSKDNALSARINGVYGAKRYKAIASYIHEVLGNENIQLSDGRLAIVDNSDALHIANKAADKKASQIAQIRELVKNAEIFAQDTKVVHDKFDLFYYYKMDVRFEGETFPVYLNVGRAKNDGNFHIYDITNKIRDTADRINGLERPVGNALTNGIPTNSIPQNGTGVNYQISGNPSTVRDAIGRSNKYAKEMLTYFKELKQDVEGISKKRSQERAYNDAVAYIRSAYATYQLGANPKVWVTQLSSLIAATNILDADALAKGLKVSGKDVDEYCRLAWLRNNDNAAAMAQAVSTPQNAVAGTPTHCISHSGGEINILTKSTHTQKGEKTSPHAYL